MRKTKIQEKDLDTVKSPQIRTPYTQENDLDTGKKIKKTSDKKGDTRRP